MNFLSFLSFDLPSQSDIDSASERIILLVMKSLQNVRANVLCVIPGP